MSDRSKTIIVWVGTIILPLIAIIVPIAIYLISEDEKELSYEILGQYQLINSELTNDEVEIKYLGNIVNNLELTSFRITNSGYIPITLNDYEREIKVLFSPNASIYSVKKGPSYPDNLNPIIINEGDYVAISPLLLNPGDNFVVEVILSEYKPTFEVDGRIAGIREIIEKSTLNDQELDDKSMNILLMILILCSSFLYAIAAKYLGIPSLRKSFKAKDSFFSKKIYITIFLLSAFCSSGSFLVYTNMFKEFRWFDTFWVIIPIMIVVGYGSNREKKLKIEAEETPNESS